MNRNRKKVIVWQRTPQPHAARTEEKKKKKDRLAIAKRSLLDRIVTIASLTCVLLSCVVGVLLGCISVVFTVRDSSTPDSKENKQADAGSRLFSKIFSLRRVVVELFISRARRSIYTHVQRECSAKSFMRSILCHKGSSRLSQVLAYTTIFYRDANSVLLSTPLYSSRFYAQNPVFEIAHRESVKVSHTSNCEKPVYSCSIFNYLRGAVCNLYKSIFSTGPVPQWY